MADDEKEKSANQILQALDALSQTLNQARAIRRTTSLTPPRSTKDGDDVVGAVDAAEEEARPRPRRRLSPASPFRSRHKLDKIKNDDEEEEEDDDDSVHSAPLKSQQGFAAVTPEDVAADGEKKGVMSWGPIRVLSHIGMRRFGCLFSVEVVAAQGLPPSMNGLRLAVNVRKKETRDGAADSDEALYVRCSLYGTGGAAKGKPRPFLLSVAIDAPELDFGRSTVDLSLFAKEFTEKCQQGDVRQWDVVFPLAAKAKGGDLVVKLAFQSIDNGGAGMYSQPAGEDKTSALFSFSRKLRRSTISNMLTSKMTHTRTPKLSVPAPDLQGIDSFMLDESEPEPAPVADEVKEKQQEEPETEPTPVVELKEEPQEEPELAAELAPAAEVKEEEQKEPEPEPEPEDAQDHDSELPEFDVIDNSVERQEEKAELKEEADEAKKESEGAPVVAGDEVAKKVANELEIQALEEETPSDVSDAVADAVEPGDAEVAGVEEASVVAGDEVAKEMANELETMALDEATPNDVSDAAADAVEPVDAEVAGLKEASVVAGDEAAKEVANELETKALEEAMPSNVSDVVANAVEPVDAKTAGSEEASVVAGDEVANELETKALEEATTPNDMSGAVANAAEPMEQVNGESLHVLEKGEDKGTATKPSRRRRRFGWRILAFLVTPVAVVVSKNLATKR